jgi:hypothetical protein
VPFAAFQAADRPYRQFRAVGKLFLGQSGASSQPGQERAE